MKISVLLPENLKIALAVILALVLAGVGGCLAQRKLFGVAAGVTVEGYAVGGFLPHEATQLVTHLAIELNRPAKDATLTKKGEIIAEIPGFEVDIELSVQKILDAEKGEKVLLVVYRPQPEITAALLGQVTEVLGKYSTFVSGSQNRLKNITLAAKKLNFTLVKPHTLFSFNQTLGPRTAAQGYLPAPVIIGEGHGLDAGGGVCQVSSTLFNAALQANFKIVERHPHSKRVFYVPPGRDATVSFPGLDFKFYNQHVAPAIIRSAVQGRVLTIWILGTQEVKEKLQGGE